MGVSWGAARPFSKTKFQEKLPPISINQHPTPQINFFLSSTYPLLIEQSKINPASSSKRAAKHLDVNITVFFFKKCHLHEHLNGIQINKTFHTYNIFRMFLYESTKVESSSANIHIKKQEITPTCLRIVLSPTIDSSPTP